MALDGGSVEIRFEGDVSPIRRSIESIAEKLSSLKSAASKTEEGLRDSLGGDWSKDASDAFFEFSDIATESLQKVSNSASEVNSSMQSLGSSLKGLTFDALSIGATSAVGALTSLVSKGIQATDFLETSRVAMAGLMGSMDAGNRAMSIAAKFWQNNPFQRLDVTNATKQLVQFGRTNNQIGSDLEMLGNVSLSTGMQIDQLARYYARVSASGRAMTIDLEMMSDRGVPIYKELAKALNTTTAGVREMASKGKIDFETFRKAMESAVNPEAMEAYENTLARQRDRYKGSIQILAGELAGYKIINDQLVISEQGLEKAWTRLLKVMATGLRSDSMKAGMEKIGQALAKIVDIIAKFAEPALKRLGDLLGFIGNNIELLIPIFGVALVTIGRIGSQLPIIGKFLSPITNHIGGLTKGLKSLVLAHPALSAFIALFGAGFINAMKNSEQFRNTIKSIGTSLGQIFQNLTTTFKGVIDALTRVFNTLANSGVVQGILQGVASALAWIAKALSSISPDTLAGLLTFFVSLRMLKANPIMFVASALAMLITYIKELGGIGKIFENLPQTLKTIGHNIITGLVNGIKEGARKVLDFVKNLANAIKNTFKKMLGIHSPSTVMYEMGKYVVLGLAEGIQDNSDVVAVAMDNLASDILKLSEKVIGDKVDFGILDLKGQYQEWKKVSQMFAVGSEQYNMAIEKMEGARKNANLKILELQRTYNDSLDKTISKISSMYGLLDNVNLKAGKNSAQILKGLDQQVAKTQEWAEAQKMIRGTGLDSRLIKELQSMGVDATSELSAIANMSASELENLNEMWLKKQEIANLEGVAQMEDFKNETLAEINDLKNGIDGITVDVADVGGRLVENISEGVYGAMPTLEDAFSKLGDYIRKASKSLGSDSGLGDTGGLDEEDLSPQSMLEEISADFGKIKDMLPKMLLGAIGAIGVAKFGPKIVKKLFNVLGNQFLKGGNISQGIAGSLFKASDLGMGIRGGLLEAIDKIPREEYTVGGKVLNKIQGWLTPKDKGKIVEAAKTATESSKSVQTIAQNSTQISNGIATTGKSMSKVDSFLNTIIRGGVAIIAIAGAIAAMAGALWLTYNALKDIDWEKLAMDLGGMALAVGVFGTLAAVAGKLVGLKGILIIAGIAADIALVALGCRIAYEAMKVITWEDFGNMIGQMAAAIGVFGAFAGLFGLIASIEAFGLLVIAGIALDIVAISYACREAYDTMKGMDWETWGQILDAMIESLAVMGGFQALFGLLAPLEFLGWGSIMAICHSLTRVADAVVEINQKIPDDITGVKKKITLLTEVLNDISNANLGNFFKNIGQAINATSVMALVGAYTQMAEGLARIQEITLKKDAIVANVGLIKQIVDTLGVTDNESFGSQILKTVNTFLEAIKTVAVGSIVSTYKNMAEDLNYIQDVKLEYDTIVGKVKKLKEIVDMLAKTDETSFWGQLEAVVNTFLESAKTSAVGSIIATYVEMADNLNKIQEVKLNKEQIEAVVEDFAWVVETISKPATEKGFWQQLGDMVKTAMQVGITDNAKKILEIYGTMGDAINSIKEVPVDEEGVENKISALNRVVQSIVDMKGDGGIFGAIGNFFTGNPITPEKVEQVLEILRKFGDIANTVNYIPGIYVDGFKEKIAAQQSVIDLVAGIKDPGNILVKEAILGVAQSMLNKLTEMAWTVNSLPAVKKDRAIAIISTLQEIVWQIGQVNQNGSDTLTTKEWVIGMATSMAYKLGEFTHAVNSIGALNDGGIVQQAIDTMNSMFDNLTTQLSENAIAFENVGANIGIRFAEGVRSQIGTVQEAGYQLQGSLWSAIESKMQDEFYQGAYMATKFGEGLKSVSFANIGADMQGSLWNAIQAKMNDEYWQGKTMGERFRQGLYDVDYGNAGWWAVQGFTNGANNRDPYSAGWQIANRFLQGLKDRGQQGSPWKTTIESGNWAVEGLIEGIKEQESALVGEATSLADQVVEALTMDNLTMSPTLDASVEGHLAPNMSDSEYAIVGGNNGGVVINQTNTNYTEYDVEQVQRDLAWELSKV